MPSSVSSINGDRVEKRSFHEPVTSSLIEAEAKSSFESEGICESKVAPSSKLAGSEEGKDKNDEGEGREMMKKVDNDQHHHDSFKIEKDSSSSLQNSLRVRTKSLKKKVDSIFSSSSPSEEVTTPPTVTTPSTVTTVTTPQPSYTVGSKINTIPSSSISSSLETDVVTQLCFEPVEVLVKDLEPKEQVDDYDEDDIHQLSFKQSAKHSGDTMNGCPKSNSKIYSTGAITGNNKSREDMRHAMKPSHSSSITAPVALADHAMNNGKKSSSNDNNSSNTNIFKRSSSIKDLREKQNEAEIKIAREILELKQREEELRIMRQEMNRINALRAKEDIKAVPSDVSSVEIDGRCSPSSSEISTTESVSGRISVDSLESHSNCHSNSSSSSTDHHLHHNYHNHHNKVKRPSNNNIKVKPFEEKLDHENVSYFNQGMNSLLKKKQESPIEREIRILKEREEELRLEKLKRSQGSGMYAYNIIYSNFVSLILFFFSSSFPVTPNRGTHPEGVSSPITPQEHTTARPLATNGVSSSASLSLSSSNGELFQTSNKPSNGSTNGIQIQKVLATTRIQQEIEEQTQREMALRASGSIKTISHERTDIKVVPTKLCGPPPVDSVNKTPVNFVSEAKIVLE